MKSMTQHFRSSLVLAMLLVIAPAFGKLDSADGFEPTVGKALADFRLPRIDNGEPKSLSDFRGKKTLLIVFASW